jgi:hypothetical protein
MLSHPLAILLAPLRAAFTRSTWQKVVLLVEGTLLTHGVGPSQQQATFTDVLAAVRRHLWHDLSSSTSPQNPDVILLPRSALSRFADLVCSSA